MSMRSANRKKTRLEKLTELAKVLAKEIDLCEDQKTLPQLARQYRETIREIEEIERTGEDGDEIAQILNERDAAGKPGAVR